MNYDGFSSKTKIAVIIVAAGSSSRMGGKTKKEYLPLKNGTVLSECVKKFLDSIKDFQLVITIPKNGKSDAEKALFSDSCVSSELKQKNVSFVEGGSTRQESVLNALKFLSQNEPPKIVLIHDGARPFVNEETILKTLDAALEFGAAAPGIVPTDTQKIIDENGFIKTHLERSKMIAIQTPQGFDFEKLFDSHKKAALENRDFTDDTEIFALFEGKVKIVQGSPENKKITYPKDYSNDSDSEKKDFKMEIRCGLGYDLHRLTEGRKFLLGGIEIPFEKGEDAHSDGDVLLHAITDSLLGASGLGDIGSYFPPEDDKWKNADSKMLLKTCWNDVKNAGWNLSNLDCVIKLEKPKFIPFRKNVIESIAKILEVPKEKIFVKAKTSEKLESVGEGKAVEVFANCILYR